jgi:hypothetical protein
MIFGRKSSSEGSNSGDAAAPQFSPEKAKRFFDHAKTVHETGNFEYAVQSWLTGLRMEPDNMPALQGFFRSIGEFLNSEGGKKGLSRETTKPISGKTDVDRYLSSVVEWAQSSTDAACAVRATEAAQKLGMKEPVKFIAERALVLCARDKRPRKDWFLKLSDAFSMAESFDRSIESAQMALKIDPSDQELANSIKNLSAQAAMAKGKYGSTGEGGFRQSIRDSDKQRMLDDADRISKTDETLDRLVAAAEAELAARPNDLPTVEKLCRALLSRAGKGDEDRAYDLYMKTYMETQQFRMRQNAGEIKRRKQARALSEAKRAAEANPADAAAQEALRAANRATLALDIDELKLIIENYPTNLQYKYELGKRFVLAERFEEAIPTLQEAQNDPKYRGPVMNYLGLAFLKINYPGDAVEMFRKGLEIRDISEELELELRYGLMSALHAKAEADRELMSAEEADKVASAIMTKQFGYKDVKARRDAIKKLIASLRGGPAMS